MSGKDLSSYLKPQGSMSGVIAEHEEMCLDNLDLDAAEIAADKLRSAGSEELVDDGDCDGCKI